MLNEYFSACFNASVPPLSQLDEESQTHVEFESTCSEDLMYHGGGPVIHPNIGCH